VTKKSNRSAVSAAGQGPVLSPAVASQLVELVAQAGADAPLVDGEGRLLQQLTKIVLEARWTPTWAWGRLRPGRQ
jgi:hypothetical protein